MFILPLIIDFLIISRLRLIDIEKLVLFIIMYVPLYEIWKESVNNILRHIIKQSKLPKINYENGIDSKNKTMVVIPCVLDTEKKVKEMLKKIEVYYLANEDENIYFTLLGDCTTSEKEVEKEDSQIIKSGKEEVKRLNEKYKKITSLISYIEKEYGTHKKLVIWDGKEKEDY